MIVQRLGDELMAAFFQDLIEEFTEPDFFKKVRDKFHYGEAQADELKCVAVEMLPLIRKEAFWERHISSLLYLSGSLAGNSAGNTSSDLTADSLRAELEDTKHQDTVYEDVVMSLGSGIDALQDQYSSQGMLSRSYMLEVLASEFLLRGYEAYNRYIEINTDMHVAKYHFLGSEDSVLLEELPKLLAGTSGRVTCNEALCMIPKKSVAFVAELTRDENVRCEGICVGCRNRHCTNRVEENSEAGRMAARMTDLPLTYGYGRIFGRI